MLKDDVKKEVFGWIKTGQKTIELRRGRARAVCVKGTCTLIYK